MTRTYGKGGLSARDKTVGVWGFLGLLGPSRDSPIGSQSHTGGRFTLKVVPEMDHRCLEFLFFTQHWGVFT